MSITIAIESSKLTRKLKEYASVTGKGTKRVLKDEMRLLVGDLIKITAPSYGTGASKDAQRVGENAVKRDINRVWVTTEQLVSKMRNKKLAASMRKYVSAGNIQAIKTILSRFNSSLAVANIELDLNPLLHRLSKNKRGIVPKSTKQTLLVRGNTRTLNQYIKLIQTHVGRAKAGWLAAAGKFGTKGIPAWVKRHSTSEGAATERYIESGGKLVGGELTAINRNRAIGDLERSQSIVKTALIGRQRSLESKIKDHLQFGAKKFNAT